MLVGEAGKPRIQVQILNSATTYYLSAIAVAIGFKMNLFNIGVDGQYRLAALIAAAVGGAVGLPAPLHVAAHRRRGHARRCAAGPASPGCSR